MKSFFLFHNYEQLSQAACIPTTQITTTDEKRKTLQKCTIFDCRSRRAISRQLAARRLKSALKWWGTSPVCTMAVWYNIGNLKMPPSLTESIRGNESRGAHTDQSPHKASASASTCSPTNQFEMSRRASEVILAVRVIST